MNAIKISVRLLLYLSLNILYHIGLINLHGRYDEASNDPRELAGSVRGLVFGHKTAKKKRRYA